MTKLITLILLVTAFSANAHAWGKRGHSIICQTAAYLSAKNPKAEFMKKHSFDFGYYCNVPDLVWKKGNLYELEWFNHFMDLEIFDREFKDSKVEKPFEMDRLAFNAAYPKIQDSAGRAYWRVRELMDATDKIVTELKKPDLKKEDRHKLQADWLLHMGAMGHYVGDLVQPLHVTENYDGQMTNQKGIHGFYEEDVVDHLFLDRGMGLENDVMKAAEIQWKKLHAAYDKKSVLDVMQDIAKTSNRELANVLKLDKKLGRNDVSKAAQAYRKAIVERMALGAVALSGLWNRKLGWDYDGKRFYNFYSDPPFIAPPRAPVASPTPAASPQAQ